LEIGNLKLQIAKRLASEDKFADFIPISLFFSRRKSTSAFVIHNIGSPGNEEGSWPE
jgi:hypothetical protein